MVGLNIYQDNPYIGIWLEQYYYSLPLWRRLLSKLPFEKHKISQKEFETWLRNKNNQLTPRRFGEIKYI